MGDEPLFPIAVTLFCPIHGPRYYRGPSDTEPFPDPAACGYPVGQQFGTYCTEACVERIETEGADHG